MQTVGTLRESDGWYLDVHESTPEEQEVQLQRLQVPEEGPPLAPAEHVPLEWHQPHVFSAIHEEHVDFVGHASVVNTPAYKYENSVLYEGVAVVHDSM
jgi:hypothetical protein